MKKVAVVGLYSIPNMGDKILCEASQFLIQQTGADVEVVEVDVCPRYGRDYKGLEHLKYRVSRVAKIIGDALFSYENGSKLRYLYEYATWWLRLSRYYQRSFEGADAIVFAGGGFLKFRTQGLNYYVEMIVKIAEKHNIPVMMNGVGIEGYDENDIRCQNLKTVINLDVVKIITTRDDLDILRNNYVTSAHIETAHVGDPALWIPECYNVTRGVSNGTVGINVIRGKIYQAYGNTVSHQQLLAFYRGLIAEAERRGREWVLFSNGMKSDQDFGVELLTSLGKNAENKLLPAPETSEELIEMVRAFDCILGARLHAMITAYSLDVPVVGLIWNEKIRMFANIIGKPQNFFEEDALNPLQVFDAIEASIGNEYDVSIRSELKDSTKRFVDSFMSQVAHKG